ncbi:MAG: hypothetical protein CFE23_07470 [Flavobacterium sp. BFFFF1]|uniref:NAD-dependent epimerase/dehydratase family protein n=1 Tax=Flavobacterium sp. BFFFF1 TaxID=2015557 RepID=UPI000BC84622|nr:NAD-dependent epimerase/dehydratase family protein [Flavobacterium sp. BFFFF1]OYU80799.1 MAG: hypothetical protein CFE23_07470 [Flavobacterium sp. BFFFF1]
MKIAITGERGFLGIHLTAYFRYVLKFEVIELGRDYLNTLPHAGPIDWLIHAAFIHRHENPEMVLELNRRLTQDTLNCLCQNNIRCNIAFLSSIQEDNDSFYGKAKSEAKTKIHEFCTRRNMNFISYKLPNIFGKYAIPEKTSFIATFCYNLIHNKAVNFNSNEIRLCYIDDAVSTIATLAPNEFTYTTTNVNAVYLLLKDFHEMNLSGQFPNLKTKFELDLYQTYLGYTNYKM